MSYKEWTGIDWEDSPISEEEFEKAMPLMYENIHQNLTPDFTAEDWMSLHRKAETKDLISMDMFISMWETKVIPYLSDDFKKHLKGRGIRL